MDRKAFVVVDLGFGDQGKGTIVDFLCHKHDVSAVVRYNGGAQAGHNVVLPDGRHHEFHQFGSGSFHPGVITYLSKHMMVNPMMLWMERDELITNGTYRDPFDTLIIDEEAPITTPWHIALNRCREIARGKDRHGSCGLGIGETMADIQDENKFVLRAKHLKLDPHTLRLMFERMRWEKAVQSRKKPFAPDDSKWQLENAVLHDTSYIDAMVDICRILAKKVRISSGELPNLLEQGDVVFEGAQGVLLDEHYGFQPHTTWSKTTDENAFSLLSDVRCPWDVKVIGVTRAYSTRHGAGPFPTESGVLTRMFDEPHNNTNNWQGPFRVGFPDWVMLKYALETTFIDELAVTHLDTISQFKTMQVAEKYDNMNYIDPRDVVHNAEQHTQELFRAIPEYSWIRTEDYCDLLEKKFHLPVTIKSYGPTYDDKESVEYNQQCGRTEVRTALHT